jgi:CO/xanthine dehydrogenase Mo-binding subunit
MVIGKAVPLLDAVDRVTGRVAYTASLSFPGMLYGKVLRSFLPHARIVSIDTSAAEALPGVAAIVTRDDFNEGGLNPVYGSGADQTVVAMERVRFIGEPVALVAAESETIAEEALSLIEVEYEELPAVFDVFEAMAEGAPLIHEDHPNNVLTHAKLRHGDVEAGFAEADLIVEETYTSPVAQQAMLEQQSAIGQWQDGRLTLWTASQSPYTVRRAVSGILGVPPEEVRIVVPPLGGGFGGKGNVRTQPQAAALAWKVGGRPVRLVLKRDEEFVTVTKHQAILHIKSGVKSDGTFTARQIDVYWNAGAQASSSLHLVPAGMLRAIGPYRIPNVKVDSYGVYTNLPAAAAYRGAMSSQGVWAHESHMDSIAHELGMAPLAFRLKNLLRTGDPFATGETIHEAFFAECLQAAADGVDWDEPLEREPTPHTRRGRGLGVMMKHTIATSRSECILALDDEGRLTLYTSTVEMGQGAHTALAQISAEAVGLPLEAVTVVGPDTAITPYDAQTAASRGTYMMGNAVLNGAAELKAKLVEAAVPLLEEPPDRLTADQGFVFITDSPETRVPYTEILKRNGLPTLKAEGMFATKGGLDPETGQGIATPHWHQGAGACEVEVDLDTGKVSVLRYYATAFAGRVVNPELARLQNEGNVIFAIGPTFMEEVIVDGGQIVNPNLSDYLIPSILDIPTQLESASLESDSGELHGLGEMTLPPVAPAIANAIFDAVGARIRDLPITPEKVYRAITGQSDE